MSSIFPQAVLILTLELVTLGFYLTILWMVRKVSNLETRLP